MDFKELFEPVLRQCVFIILNIYAVSKILGGQFYMNGKIPAEVASTTLGEASSFALAWTFMGHSYLYILFVGLSQLIGAWMLLWNKTKVLGVAILLPIMINIILFDLIFLDVYPALANAIIVLAMLLMILFLNKEKVVTAFKELTTFPTPDVPVKRRLITLGVTVLVMALIFSFDSLIELWFGASLEKVIE